jgi:serine/threonine-protein kinase
VGGGAHDGNVETQMSVAAAVGRVLQGKYRLLERVGVGGMSEVYRAEALDDKRIVAVKLLMRERADDPNLGARLVHEAQAVMRIRHPSIAEVFDVGQSELGPFIVLEYLRGDSAAKILTERGRFGLQATLATIFPVLDALNAAHEAGVVHRDIKPGNVFYGVDSRANLTVKLLDFGVAKTIWPTGPTPKTSTGVVMGTPDYLSPEQANGEWNIDGRSDIFAVGVLMFELLTATRPFHAPSAVATAYKIAHSRTPLLRDYDGPNSDTLQAILERALAKRPEERHGSAGELRAELQTLAGTEAALARALSEVVRPDRFLSESGEQPIPSMLRGSTAPDGPAARRLSQPDVRTSSPPQSPVTPERILSRSAALRRADTLPENGNPFKSPTPSPGVLHRLVGADSGQTEHVRGVVLNAVDKFVQTTFGKGPRERILSTLPKEIAQELELSALQAIVLYDLAAVNAYLDGVTNDICRSNPSWARTAGVAAVKGDLAPILRSALRPGDLPVVLRRIMPVFSRLFDFGNWEVEATQLGATMRVGEFQSANLPLRLWLVGAVEGTLSACEVPARTIVARGDVAHAPHLIVDVVSA